MRLSYKIITRLIHLIMKTFFGLKIIHMERISSIKNNLIAANHISWVDPPFIGSIFPFEIHYLAKAELFKNKFFGRLLEFLNSIPLRRGTIDRKAVEKAQQVLEKGHSLLLFPEGSRKVFKAKAGIGKIAYQMQKNIIPIYIHNSNQLWKCFLRKSNLQIVIGKPISISDFTEENKKKLYYEIAEYTLKKIYELKNDCSNS